MLSRFKPLLVVNGRKGSRRLLLGALVATAVAVAPAASATVVSCGTAPWQKPCGTPKEEPKKEEPKCGSAPWQRQKCEPPKEESPPPREELRPPNPAENIKHGSGRPCQGGETELVCEEWWVGELDRARGIEGLPPYPIPPGFYAAGYERQYLDLINDDRTAYGISSIIGLNPTLNEFAAIGVADEADPHAGPGWEFSGSVWADTPPFWAYFLYVYDDGYQSPNVDCPTPMSAGCWGHRQILLYYDHGNPRAELGVAGGELGSAAIISSRP